MTILSLAIVTNQRRSSQGVSVAHVLLDTAAAARPFPRVSRHEQEHSPEAKGSGAERGAAIVARGDSGTARTKAGRFLRRGGSRTARTNAQPFRQRLGMTEIGPAKMATKEEEGPYLAVKRTGTTLTASLQHFDNTFYWQKWRFMGNGAKKEGRFVTRLVLCSGVEAYFGISNSQDNHSGDTSPIFRQKHGRTQAPLRLEASVVLNHWKQRLSQPYTIDWHGEPGSPK